MGAEIVRCLRIERIPRIERLIGPIEQRVPLELTQALMIHLGRAFDAIAFGLREADRDRCARRLGARGPAHITPSGSPW